MEDLLSYRLSDLLIFSEQTFYRQFALYQQPIAPFYYLTYLYGLVFAYAWTGRRIAVFRALSLVTTLLWVICIYGYLHKLYAQIHSVAGYFIPLLSIQVPLLLLAAFRTLSAHTSYTTLSLWVAGLCLPVFELAAGQSLEVIPAYALTPDSLAICSMALVITLRQSCLLFLPALLWIVFSVLTYFAMRNSMAWYLCCVLTMMAFACIHDRYFKRPK